MRVRDKLVSSAFHAGVAKTVDTVSTDGVSLFYHGNKIATKENGTLRFTLAGWDTVTTRTRLNSIGIRLERIKGVTHYNGEPINSNEWYDVVEQTANC